MQGRLSYSIGRVAGVASRPAALFLANNLMAASTAQGVAIAMLASSLGLVAVAADPHRRFYARHFDEQRRGNGFAFHVYVWSIFYLMLGGALLAGAVALYFAGSPALACAAAVYFASEKLVDEVLRFRLFEREFATWGRSSIARCVLQLSLFGALFLMLKQRLDASVIILAFTAGNLIVFARYPLGILSRALPGTHFRAFAHLSARAARGLFQNRMLWVIALMTSAIGYLDRLVALVIDKASLPVFMLVVMCFSTVQMAVDFFYVSRHRRDFLDRRISVAAAFGRNGLLASFVAGLLVASIACAVVLATSRNADSFPLFYVFAIAILQSTVACAGVLREIVYWTQNLRQILVVEAAFWVLVTIVAGVGRWLGLNVDATFALVVGAVLARLALYFVFAARAPLAASSSNRPEAQ